MAGSTVAQLPLADLLPTIAKLDHQWPIAASGGEPPQLLLLWLASVMDAPQGGPLHPETLYRVILWTRDRQLASGRWRWTAYGVMTTGAPNGNLEEITLADLTGDNHPEILSHYIVGNHNSGPFDIVATIAGRPRDVLFHASGWIETYWHVRFHILHVDVPDYRTNGGMCCPGGYFHLTYGWNGTRLVVAKRTRTGH